MQGGSSYKTALSGILCGAAVALLLVGNVVPFAIFCAPAAAGCLVEIINLECGAKYGRAAFAAVSLLSLILLSEKEEAFCFIALLGYYPMLKPSLEKAVAGPLRIAAKLALYSVSIGTVYFLLLWVFMPGALKGDSFLLGCIMLAVGAVAFLVYDCALTSIQLIYQLVIHKRIRSANNR